MSERRNEHNGNTDLNQYFGTLRPETVFAHTSPIYVIVDEKPVKSPDDAAYFVRYLENSKNWLSKSGNFPDDEAKDKVLDAFDNGIDIFKSLTQPDK